MYKINNRSAQDCILALTRKGAKFDHSKKVITIDNQSGKFGNRSWGKLDQLVKEGWSVQNLAGRTLAA